MHNVLFVIMVIMKMRIWLFSVVTATFQSIKAVMGLNSFLKVTGFVITVKFSVSKKVCLWIAFYALKREVLWNLQISLHLMKTLKNTIQAQVQTKKSITRNQVMLINYSHLQANNCHILIILIMIRNLLLVKTKIKIWVLQLSWIENSIINLI